ncbi:[NiFe]-hydrogenase assembly chaperone HybE [Sphaerotilus microaerophilus]|uniref:[NiFe] hydrogenase assembly chaperone, HybE family n=1 Tax=Sphaerotilus microaerophilus TaxID=2914710 RepID=A0ABN6PIA8_9BURK|nr:[NiFe]-hydrogenase assembly chaperone HybE [Sphaerotilus sp. FB-5]BDI04771.1 hypothetical protein CATMQ487_17410 [Sphaerotilus sp. FB-5]
MTPPRCGFAAPPQGGAASGPAKPDPRRLLDAVEQRIDNLERTFRHIAATRMAGVPVLHAALQVRAVGFAPLPDAPGWLCGVLVTPWFMNLLRLPVQPLADLAGAAAAGCLQVGRDALRAVGGSEPLYFVGAQEDRLGHYEQCSLYSPMFHFADQAAAVATAAEVMKLLRTPATASVTASPATAPAASSVPAGPVAAPAAAPTPVERPARRGFLFGGTRAADQRP